MNQTLSNKVAVVTGGASGMGRAMAQRFATAGARVVVADIEEPAIEDTVSALEATGADVFGVRTDVSSEESMDQLGISVNDRYGRADIVCLNAGVGAGGPAAGLRTSDWAWVLGVNLWGVIHGLRVFLPGMEARDEGHVVVTASVAGILSYPLMAPYNASKHAALSIAESLHHELAAKGSGVGVSALCPGLVNTRILESGRNRPEEYLDPALSDDALASDAARAMAREIYEGALSPEAVAEMVHDAIVERRFYILTDHVFDDAIRQRHREIERRENPHMEAHLLETHLRGQTS